MSYPESAQLLKSRTKHRQIAEQIAADVAEFLARGGVIHRCDGTAEPDRMITMPEFAEMLGISLRKMRIELANRSIPRASWYGKSLWRHAEAVKFAAIYQAPKRSTRHG